MADFQNILISSTFTFLVGPDYLKVTVQANLFEGVSDPLHAMMTNGRMAESSTGEAILDDVDVSAFFALCEFAYNRNYKSAITRAEAESRFGRLDSIHDKKTWRGLKDEQPWVCYQGGMPGPWTNIEWTSKSGKMVQLYRPIRNGASWKRFEGLEYANGRSGGPSTILLHAKVVNLASRYLSAELKDLALANLHKTLCAAELARRDWVDAILELLEYVYSEAVYTPTSECGSSPESVSEEEVQCTESEDGDEAKAEDKKGPVTMGLQMLVSRYAACKVEVLIQDRQFRSILKRQNDLSVDLLNWQYDRVMGVFPERDKDEFAPIEKIVPTLDTSDEA